MKLGMAFLAIGLIACTAGNADAKTPKFIKVLDPCNVSAGCRVIFRHEKPGEAVKGAAGAGLHILAIPHEVVAGGEQKIENWITERSKLLGQSLAITRLPQKITRQVIISAGSGKIENIQAAPLAGAIRQAELQYKDRAQPIPEVVKTMLSASFEKNILNEAKYVVDKSLTSVAGAINKLKDKAGNNHAVTVNNIIVFANMPTSNEIHFWAHELQHVVQYNALGIDGFAAKYLTKSAEMENEAEKVADKAVTEAQTIMRFMVAQAPPAQPQPPKKK